MGRLNLNKRNKSFDRERWEGAEASTQGQGAADGIAIGIVKLSLVPGGPQIETIYTGGLLLNPPSINLYWSW